MVLYPDQSWFCIRISHGSVAGSVMDQYPDQCWICRPVPDRPLTAALRVAVDPGLRSQLLPVRDPEEVAALHEHEEHDPEALRRPLQGHL